MLIVGLAIALMVGLVSAAVITYFGQVQMTATVKQAVLLDGKDYTQMPITESATVAGGECVCTHHWLESQTSVPVSLKFETDITYDGGITVEYYKPVKLQLTDSDFKYKNDITAFDALVLMYWDGGKVVWEVGIDENDISGHWSTGVQVMIAGAFILGWSPGESTTSPIYKPWTGTGWGTPTTTLPEGMSVNGTYNQVSYKIEIPVKYLGGCGATFNWAINIEASWPGYSGSHYAQYPKDWVRWTATNTATFHIGELITSPFTLAPYEKLDFIICYKFAVDIWPGEYTITTTVKPAP